MGRGLSGTVLSATDEVAAVARSVALLATVFSRPGACPAELVQAFQSAVRLAGYRRPDEEAGFDGGRAALLVAKASCGEWSPPPPELHEIIDCL